MYKHEDGMWKEGKGGGGRVRWQWALFLLFKSFEVYQWLRIKKWLTEKSELNIDSE